MKRLEPTLTALVIAVAATMAWPSVGAAVLSGDDLTCATEAGQGGVEYAATILPKLQEACVENKFGLCKANEADIAGDHDAFVADIVESCEGQEGAFEGFCKGEDIDDIAECVADAYDAGATMFADASVGGGLPPPQVVTIIMDVPQVCSQVGGPCHGPKTTGCCRGLVCRISSSVTDGELITSETCVPAPSPPPQPSPTPGACPPYCSASRAFMDPSRSLLE